MSEFRVDPRLADEARRLARRCGWRASELYLVLRDWTRACTIQEAVRALEVVAGCAQELPSAEFRDVLETVQAHASAELRARSCARPRAEGHV